MKSKFHWEICCNLLEAYPTASIQTLICVSDQCCPSKCKNIAQNKDFFFFFLPVLIPVRVTSIHPHFLLKKQEACVVGMEQQAGMPR